MGERGHSVHLLDGTVGEGMARIGHRVAILGANERWTTFVPTKTSSFDGAQASTLLDRPLLQVWFDDDAGVSLLAYAEGEQVGELSLPNEGYESAESDLVFVQTLETLGVLSRKQRASLLKRLAAPTTLHRWTMRHGLEKLLALPFYVPVPSDVPERTLLELLPVDAIVLEGKKVKAKTSKTKSRTPTPAVATPTKETWSRDEKATLDLHAEYWATVFSMNNWKLYNRYKKHLPAAERSDVDRLCSAVATGDDNAIHRLAKEILARIWACEDWNAVIRDPALIDGDDDAWKEWRARLT
jgi:hypothetical protein